MQNLCSAAKQIIAENSGFRFEFWLSEWETDFLRFYNSQTNYNISKKTYSVYGTIEKDQKKYSFSLSNPNESALRDAVVEGLGIVEQLPPDPDFVNFEDNKEIFEYKNFTTTLETVSLDQKIDILEKLAAMSAKYDFGIYGTFITLAVKSWQVNSNGLEKLHFSSPVMLDCKAVSNKNMVTVINNYGGNNLNNFNLEKFSAELENRIKFGTLPVVDMEPGDYEVILSPLAANELLQMLMGGAYAASLDSKEAFFEGKENKQVFPESVTISSLPQSPKVINFGYNGDGHLAKDLTVIENGIFKNFFIDNYYGHKLKMAKNGSVGSRALVMEPGTKSFDEMIKGVKKGLYICNLHYMNFINQKETSVTGLTRDGSFLIENGKIVNTVNNLRFTEKISEIFEHITELENENHTIPSSGNYDNFSIHSACLPHVKSSRFKVSSSTHTI